MKKYQLFFLILFFAALNSFAQNIRGINIESSCERVVVFLNGERVCDPVESCMIANLSPGYYFLEAFGLDARGRYDRSVYSRRIYFDGNGLTKIELFDNSFIGVPPRGPASPVPPQPSDPYLGGRGAIYFEPMTDQDFNIMLANINKATFKSDRLAVIDIVADDSYLSVNQLGRLLDNFSFDDEKLSVFKKFYPNIVDKENLFTLLDKFSFGNSKTKIKNYINEQKKRRKDNDLLP